jgi:hypothetical protein
LNKNRQELLRTTSNSISIHGLSRIAKNYRRKFLGYAEKIKVVKSNAF